MVFCHTFQLPYKSQATNRQYRRRDTTFLLDEMGLINESIARLLYSGLVTDSGGFSFSSVTADTMKAASILLKFDIKAHEICEHFMKKIKYDELPYKSQATNRQYRRRD